MSQSIGERRGPFTIERLTRDLRQLGLTPNTTVVVHSSLSAIGYVVGGAHAVVLALLEVIGPNGTLVVPTHSGDLSDPGFWKNPPVPEAWWPAIRASMPAYDPRLTPTRGMGAIADTVRHLPGAVRSAHPSVSFCAVGPNAETITSNHRLENGFDETSPLARLYDADASILLLGVGHDKNTSLHLAESRSGTRSTLRQGAPVLLDGVRRWVTYNSLDVHTDDFEEVGTMVADAGLQRESFVGGATARLLALRSLVDFAVQWFTKNRTTR